MILTTQWFGTFLLEDGAISDKALFPKDAEEIAKRLRILQSGGLLEEEIRMVEKISDMEGGVIDGDDERLSDICSTVVDRMELDPKEHGFDASLLREATILLARKALSKKVEKDRHISQAINMVDELMKSKNVLSERLEEWYNIYFPEAVSASDHEKLVEVALNGTDRKEIADLLGMPDLEKTHTGSEVSEIERGQYHLLSKLIREIDNNIEETQNYIRNSMEEIAPNLAVVAGPSVGARLISHAGSLDRLSRLPASTVQMLGAEKALFRFLKHKGRPPKHGVIFLHPRVHSAPYWQRGKIARTFAAKISLAAKVDFHSGRDISDELVEQIDKQVEMIGKKYPKPPKKVSSRKGKGKKGKGRKRKRR